LVSDQQEQEGATSSRAMQREYEKLKRESFMAW